MKVRAPSSGPVLLGSGFRLPSVRDKWYNPVFLHAFFIVAASTFFSPDHPFLPSIDRGGVCQHFFPHVLYPGSTNFFSAFGSHRCPSLITVSGANAAKTTPAQRMDSRRDGDRNSNTTQHKNPLRTNHKWDVDFGQFDIGQLAEIEMAEIEMAELEDWVWGLAGVPVSVSVSVCVLCLCLLVCFVSVGVLVSWVCWFLLLCMWVFHGVFFHRCGFTRTPLYSSAGWPKISLFFSFSRHILVFSLSRGGLLVELWPRGRGHGPPQLCVWAP